MKKITLNVHGMSCNYCVHCIEENVGELKGVGHVKVRLSEENIGVAFDSTIVDLKEITEVIEEQGYEVAY